MGAKFGGKVARGLKSDLHPLHQFRRLHSWYEVIEGETNREHPRILWKCLWHFVRRIAEICNKIELRILYDGYNIDVVVSSLSRVLPTSRVFTSGYVNTETILHFFYKITNERGTKTVFTYAHVKWLYGQSERAYYLNYFIICNNRQATQFLTTSYSKL